MGKYVLVVDRGSTNVKAVLVDVNGKETAVSSCPSQKPVSLKPGWWEQDMEMIWENSVQAIRGIFSKGYLPEDILGVFVTGQGNGMMPVGQDGKPSRMGILSLDSRAAEIQSGWIEDGRYGKAVETVKMPFGTGAPLPLLAWFLQQEPEEFKKIHTVLFSKDWIRYKLCGVLCTDRTEASGAGLMDLSKNDYAYEVFRLLGLDAIIEKLPPIHLPHEIVGAVTGQAAMETGLNEGTPVLCGAHDTAAYPFGVGTIDSKQLVSVIGTWGMNVVPVKDLAGAPAGLYHTVPGYFLSIAGDGNSGGCFDLMIDRLCQHEKAEAKEKNLSVYQYLEDMVLSAPPTGILFQPFVFGHAFNSSAGAGFYGIRNWHTKADYMRAVYEGIVMGHYYYIRLIPDYGKFESVWLIGGGSQSRIFGQMFADITGLKVKVPEVKEVTARGGALAALVGLGIYEGYDKAAIPSEVAVEYTPNPKLREFYQKKYEIFIKTLDMNRGVWDELNQMNLGGLS